MSKRILVLLVGSADTKESNAYQVLQEESAISEAKSAGVVAEIVFAAGFDQLRVIRKRMSDAAAPSLDAVIVEPGSVASTGLILKELKGRAGLVLLNAWSPEIDEYAKIWGAGLPFGTLSTDHSEVGKLQGRQANAMLTEGGQLLGVTGPQRSSAAVERLEGLRATLRPDVTLYEAISGGWTEQDGAGAFESWYSLYKARTFRVDVIAAQSDELAVGARAAAEAVANPGHREIFRKAKVLGVDACPAYGRGLVDAGRLTASVTTPANTGEAIRALRKFWESGRALALKAFTKATPYPQTADR